MVGRSQSSSSLQSIDDAEVLTKRTGASPAGASSTRVPERSQPTKRQEPEELKVEDLLDQ